MRAYRFRIYPTKIQQLEMQKHLLISKTLWNTLLENSKNLYETTGKIPKKTELQALTKNSGLYAETAQCVSHRLYNALARMLKTRNTKNEIGFPRFKSIDRMKSLYYPRDGFWLRDKLKVSPFGEISIVKHREIEGKIKTLTLKREASGKWFATFCVEQKKHIPRANNGTRVGIDLGLINFAVLSDGTIIKNPRHLKKHAENLADKQRKLSRKKKGSIRRKIAKKKVARLYEKVRNTRRDFLHKLSIQLVKSHSLIALEDLPVQEMAQRNYAKHIYDAGWGEFANMLSYKAESAGSRVVFVNPKNTTQECSNCHKLVKKELWERTHRCECGLEIDRDLNASINILNRATAGSAESNAREDGSIPSMRREAIQ